jgi:hypothetical protein
MGAFFSDGLFHHRHEEKCEHDRECRKNQESIEIRQGRGLLFAQVLQGLPSHLLCTDRISGLLQEALLGLRDGGKPDDLSTD